MSGPVFSSAENTPSLRRLETVFRVLFAAFAFVCAVPLLSLAASTSWSPGHTVPLALALLSTLMTLLRWHPVSCLVTMAAGVVVAILSTTEAAPLAPRLLLGVFAFLLVLNFRRRELVWLLIPTVLMYVGLSFLAGPPGLGIGALDDAVLSVCLSLTGATFIGVLVNIVAALDRIRVERVEAELMTSFESSNVAAGNWARRLLHDEVIGTLTAVADYRGRGMSGIVEACSRLQTLLAVDRQSEAPDRSSLAELVADVSDQSDLTVHVAAVSTVPDLEPAQADAIRRAVREALRNVSRHAGVDEATVSWWAEDQRTCLRVADRGRGQPVTARWGVRHSIEEPLAGIGGTATVEAELGRGSTVTMRWPAVPVSAAEPGLRRDHRETTRAIGEDQSLALKVALPVLAGNGWLAARHSWGDARMAEEVLLALGIVALSISVVNRVRRHSPSPTFLVLTAVAAGAGTWAGLELAGPSSTTDYNSFVIGLSSVGLTVVAFYVPLGWALVLVAPIGASVVAHLLDAGVGLGEGGAALNAATLPIVFGYLFGAYLRWARQTMDEEEKRLHEAAAEAHRRQVRRSVYARQLAHARRVALPWLSDISEGRRSIDDAQTRAEARALSIEMRDELHWPGILDTALRRRIARARAAGTDIVLGAPASTPTEIGLYLRLLDRLLDLGPQTERVLVELPCEDQPNGEVAVLPSPPTEVLTQVLRSVEGSYHEVEVDLFSTTIFLNDRVIT